MPESELTPEEHPQAQNIAYLKSLARGNGMGPPPYDSEAAVGDFWQAAGGVIAKRSVGIVAVPPCGVMTSIQQMQTLISYADGSPGLQKARAYCQLGNGEVWGPMWPYWPDDPLNEMRPATGKLGLGGDTFDDFVRKVPPHESKVVEKPVLNAGHYYPRIWRGGIAYGRLGNAVPLVTETPYHDGFIASLQQIEDLFDNLAAIFRVAHPAADNLGSYGGAIRDIIILGCTEVESQWKGILEANNVRPAGTYFKTTDYVRLLPVMKLDEYKLRLIRYPALPEFVPFQGWNATKATKSLSWYDAYNQVKHDREANFKEATLKHAIQIVAACVVMLAAQFSERVLRGYRFANVFHFTAIPSWEPKTWYYGPLPPVGWQQVNCAM